MRALLFASALAVVLVLVACGNRPEPAAPPAVQGGASAAPPPAASSAEPEPAPPPKRQRPLEIHSSCADVVTLVFGEDPKTGGRRTLNEGGTMDGPRDENGNVTIWLLNARGEPTTHVNITKGMKKLEIGRSCSTLDAH